MHKEQFLLYFKKNVKIIDHENDNEVKITNVINSAASDITNAELTLVAKEIQKLFNQKVKNQKAIPETIKKEVGMYQRSMGLRQLSKNFRPNMPSITSIGPLFGLIGLFNR